MTSLCLLFLVNMYVLVISVYTMRIWHWKSIWKVQPHWNTTEKIYKRYHTNIIAFITLKFVCYCYSGMFPSNPTENFQRYSYPLLSQVSAWFSVSYSHSVQAPSNFVYKLHRFSRLHYLSTTIIVVFVITSSRYQNNTLTETTVSKKSRKMNIYEFKR